MKDTDLKKMLHFKYVGGALMPANDKAEEYMLMLRVNELVYLTDATKRDLAMHRCFFALLNYVYAYMPERFKKEVPGDKFYNFVKHVQGKYTTVFSFRDDEKISDILDTCLELGIDAEKASTIAAKFGKTDLIEYESISFGRMSQKRFKEYISEQMPILYEEILGKFFKDEVLSGIIETIEEDFTNFMNKLI